MQTRKEEKTVPNKLCDYIRKRVLKWNRILRSNALIIGYLG